MQDNLSVYVHTHNHKTHTDRVTWIQRNIRPPTLTRGAIVNVGHAARGMTSGSRFIPWAHCPEVKLGFLKCSRLFGDDVLLRGK